MLPIQKNIATAELRRIYFYIFSDSDHITPWAGSVTGVKAQLSLRGNAEVASTADIVRRGGALHYVELTQAETNVSTGLIHARVAAAAGRDESREGWAVIVNYDTLEPGDTKEGIRAEMDSNSTQLAGIRADTEDLQARTPAALVSGRMDSSVGAAATGVITAAAVASNAIGADELATDAVTKIVTAFLGTSLGAAYANHTVSDVLKIILSVLAGKASGLDTTTATFRNPADTGNVVVATVDASGNRTVVARTP